MILTTLEVNNLRCFNGQHSIPLSHHINLFVGANNSGKSTLLKVIYQLQGYKFSGSDRSIESEGPLSTKIGFHVPPSGLLISGARISGGDYYKTEINFENDSPTITGISREMSDMYGDDGKIILTGLNIYPNQEPYNILYHLFSDRKVKEYNQDSSLDVAKNVTGNFSNLCAKVDRLKNPDKSSYNIFRQACEEILGFQVSTEYIGGGKYMALLVDDDRNIPIQVMGTGVPNLLGMIVDICTAKDKIFLIEEPENDIHPKALKGLLNLIDKKSEDNQFFISTHSNVVVRHLGAKDSTKVFEIRSNNDFSSGPKIPKSTIQEIGNSGKERIQLFEDLGYDVFDYALWKGWLFLEESSAASVIEEILIPAFAPGLQNTIKIFSAGGFVGIEDKFKNFSHLFIFAHLDSLYKERAWVIIDAGKDEAASIETLRRDFKTWDLNHFRQFSKGNFEEFYPPRFAAKVDEIFVNPQFTGTSDEKKKQKKKAKAALLVEVLEWYQANKQEAIAEFEQSAGEVIGILKEIEKALA